MGSLPTSTVYLSPIKGAEGLENRFMRSLPPWRVQHLLESPSWPGSLARVLRSVFRVLGGAPCPLDAVSQSLSQEVTCPLGQSTLCSTEGAHSSHSSSTELRAPDSNWRSLHTPAKWFLARHGLSSIRLYTDAGVNSNAPRWQRPTVSLKGCVPKGCAL